jgi:hypothetical protein
LTPHQSDALHILDLLAQESGDLDQARSLIEEAISTLRLRRSNDAIVACDAALALHPLHAEATNSKRRRWMAAGNRGD